MKELFGVASIVVGLIAIVPYFWGIYRRTAKPHMFSWIVWALISIIVSYIQFVEGAGPGGWFLLVSAVANTAIAISAYWFGTKDIKFIDWVILFVALFSIPLWIVTNTPLWSVMLVVSIEAIGYIPTIRKSWHKPYEEPVFTWITYIVAFSLTVLALESYSVTIYLYPVTFIIINIFFVAYLLLRRKCMPI